MLVDLGMGRHAFLRKVTAESGSSKVFQITRVQLIQLAALVEARQRLAAVYDHVGACGILQKCPCTPTLLGNRVRGMLGDAGPKAVSRVLLGEETLRAYEAVGIARASCFERHRVQHAITVEGMVSLDGLEEWVFGVAQVHTVKIAGDLTNDVEVPGVVLRVLRTPRARAIRMDVPFR